MWDAQVEALKDRANTVAIDLPGHGRSGGGGRSQVPEYARVVMDFIDTLPAPRPIPCGLSLGGAIAQQLLLDFPERFAAGILVSTGARMKVPPMLLEAIQKDYAAFVPWIGTFEFSSKTSAEVVKKYLDDSLKCAPASTFGDFSACDRFDVMASIASITVPVLVVSGSDDVLTPPKYVDYLEKNITNARRAHIADSGHMVPLEKPAEFNRAVGGFLDACAL
jgi:pimeloyl-ACP methyl ester carboxylesterase